eukprot:CAMPEP_0174231568 /NCGR_PEP_ID=MMETSP0417-20130205/2073_1 /TAXON_ID=242541 /ORGANISM="Mayorella sp, Strain BSH-02190019" /LENGTH=1184 /DNA_ID=CAMNT_0015309479 /DNA_START=42 /DNA_END=3599 /DNA_ORIENTATION=+
MSVQAKQEKKRGAVHKLWRSTARLATPKEKEKEKQRAAGHMSMAVGGTSSAASHSDYRRTQMLLQPNARSSLSSAWGNVSDSKQDSSFMPLLLRMLAEADLSEEAIWAGDERLFELLANFKEDLQESAHSGGCVVRFNLPMNIEEFAQSGSSSKSYKINPNLPVRQLLTMICRRLRINKPPENYQLRTLRGYPLRDECPLSMYGLGSLFASWELNVLLRLPSASDSLVAAITATTSTSTSTSTSTTTSSSNPSKAASAQSAVEAADASVVSPASGVESGVKAADGSTPSTTPLPPGLTPPTQAQLLNHESQQRYRRSTRLQVSDLQQRTCLVSILLPPLLEFSALKQKRIKVDVQAPIGRIITSICAKHGVKDPDRLVLCTVLGSQEDAEVAGGASLSAGSANSSAPTEGPSSSSTSALASAALKATSSSSSSAPSEDSGQVIVLANDKNLAWYGLGIRFEKWKLRLALREAISHHAHSQGEEMSMRYAWTQIPEAGLRLSEARSIIRDLDTGLRLYRRDLQQSQAVNSELELLSNELRSACMGLAQAGQVMDQDRRQLKSVLKELRSKHSVLLRAHADLLQRQESVRTLRAQEQEQHRLTEQQLMRAVQSAQTLRVLLEAYKEHAREEVQREQEDAQDQADRLRTKAAERLNAEQQKHAEQRAEWQAQRVELETQLSAERSAKSDLDERLAESERQRRRGEENCERLTQELAESVSQRERAQESFERREAALNAEVEQLKHSLLEERERSLQMQREALGKVVVEKQNEELQRIAMQTQEQLKKSIELQSFHQQQTEEAKLRAQKEREQAQLELERTRLTRDQKLEAVRMEMVRAETDWKRTRTRLQEAANTLRVELADKEKELLLERESAASALRAHEQMVTRLEGDISRLHSDVSQRDEKLAMARRAQDETQRALTEARSVHTAALDENHKLVAQCTQLEKRLAELDGRLTACEKQRDQFKQQTVQAQKKTDSLERTLKQTQAEVEKLKARDPGEELRQQVSRLRNQNRALGQQMGELRTAFSQALAQAQLASPRAADSTDGSAMRSAEEQADLGIPSSPVPTSFQAPIPPPPPGDLPSMAPPPAPVGPAPSLGRNGSGLSIGSLQDELMSKKGVLREVTDEMRQAARDASDTNDLVAILQRSLNARFRSIHRMQAGDDEVETLDEFDDDYDDMVFEDVSDA